MKATNIIMSLVLIVALISINSFSYANGSKISFDLQKGILTLNGDLPDAKTSEVFYLARVNGKVTILYNKNIDATTINDEIHSLVTDFKTAKFKHDNFFILVAKSNDKTERIFFQIDARTDMVTLPIKLPNKSQVQIVLPCKAFVSSIIQPADNQK